MINKHTETVSGRCGPQLLKRAGKLNDVAKEAVFGTTTTLAIYCRVNLDR